MKARSMTTPTLAALALLALTITAAVHLLGVQGFDSPIAGMGVVAVLMMMKG